MPFSLMLLLCAAIVLMVLNPFHGAVLIGAIMAAAVVLVTVIAAVLIATVWKGMKDVHDDFGRRHGF